MIIMSCYQHGFPWLSLTICLYHPLLPEGFLAYIPCPYRAVVDKFLLVGQHLDIRVKGSIEECCLWVCLYFPSSILHLGNCTRMLWAILNKSWKQYPTKQQLYNHIPPIPKAIQIYMYIYIIICNYLYIISVFQKRIAKIFVAW